MKIVIAISSFFIALFSANAMASCYWDHGFLAKFHYNPQGNVAIQKVTAHAGVFRSCNAPNCSNGAWMDVKDIPLLPNAQGELVGVASFVSGGGLGGFGSFDASALMIQYWVEYSNGHTEISPTYRYEALETFQSQRDYVPASVFESKREELESVNTDSIRKTVVEDLVFNNHC